MTVAEKATRLKQLWKLDEQISNTILGHPVQDRRKLHELQKRVRDEIRSIMNG